MLIDVNKTVFYVAIVLLIAFEAFYLTSRKKSVPDQDLVASTEVVALTEAEKKKKSESQEEQTIENFYLVDAKSQAKEFELWSTTAHKAMGSTDWNLDKVKAQIYSEDVIYTLYGLKGTIDGLTHTMVIEGDVKMVSNNGYTFNTQRLDYNPNSKKITTNDKVIMEGTGDNKIFLEGNGLDVNLKSNQMFLKENVRGKKPMSDNRTMKISSQMAEMSGKQKAMSFRGNVIIVIDLMIVKGPFAEFKYKNQKIDTLYMDGGVHLQDPDKNGSSGIAIVYFNEDKYVFKKKPFVTQGENELIGDEIIVFNGGKRVQVKNAKMEYHQMGDPKR
jgi:LPS export ABC transporter protein LptC